MRYSVIRPPRPISYAYKFTNRNRVLQCRCELGKTRERYETRLSQFLAHDPHKKKITIITFVVFVIGFHGRAVRIRRSTGYSAFHNLTHTQIYVYVLDTFDTFETRVRASLYNSTGADFGLVKREKRDCRLNEKKQQRGCICDSDFSIRFRISAF